MKITEDNFTITTIYFDGQFWCALIEQCRKGQNFAGRYVFGAEPTNPQLLDWMISGFDKVPLLPVEGRTKIRFKKVARLNQNQALLEFQNHSSHFQRLKRNMQKSGKFLAESRRSLKRGKNIF